MKRAAVINIQKYSIHDGPGIRTTVFFKGCPLKCWWCHNPESQNPDHEIMFFKERCTNCGVCIKRCPQKAVEAQEKYPKTDESKCTLCGKCTDFCPNSAKEYVGKDMTVQELMQELIKDEVFYDESGGGVTFSGGEPLVHVEFLNEILEHCIKRGIHTALDTSGFAPWEKLEQIVDKIDLFLYDIKLINNEKHLKYTGVENVNILRNLRKLSDRGCNIYIRMPIIAGINDDDEHINEVIKFISSLNILQVNLLPYHKMGMDKYRRLKMQYNLTGMEQPSNESMEKIKDRFKNSGIKVEIGG